MQLNFREFGKGTRTLLITHGLYGSMSNWNRLANRFGEDFRVITPDLRNHGRSPWHESHSYECMASDLAHLIQQQSTPPISLLGHSMGGKAAMMLALKWPHLIDNLIVADIAPVSYNTSEHEVIMAAMQHCLLQASHTREEIDIALAHSLGHNEDSSEQRAVRAFLMQNLIKDAAGNYRWRINLDVLTKYQQELLAWPRVDAVFDKPTLFLHGTRSDYVIDRHHSAISQYFPNAKLHSLEGAGHWLHAEQPHEFYAGVTRFLQ